MSALNHPDQLFASAQPQTAQGTLAERWQSLHENAQIIASMAALATESYDGEIAEFPERICEAGDERLAWAELTLEDIDAIMQPGLTALLAIQARGQDTTAPALALWREIHASRAGLLALCPAK